MFDLSAKLIWEGGEDVYAAGSKNIAKLYEYWLFFKLLEAVKETFNINSEEYKKLIKPTNDTLGLQLKEGKQVALNGTYLSKERELSIQFSYNKTFGSNKELSTEGSWTLQMDPDYTISIWPKEVGIIEAEKTEQIVHIHFDAKYKVKNKKDNSKFKPEDVFKMHAYKDAIRRTGGAYILYPGTDDKPTKFKGFHEILPGLGAFAIRPSEENSGVQNLIDFITEVKNHFLNRASQRENISTKTYQITKDGLSKELNKSIPEYFNGEKLIPNETFVLIGYCKSSDHLNWINDKLLYNFRMNNNRGALKLTQETLNAKYLLLHMNGDSSSSSIYKIQKPEYRVTSKGTLTRLGYPKPRQESYLVVKLEPCLDKEFENLSWNFKELNNYKPGRASAIPFTASLSELMEVKLNT
ncbi:nuclease domain-containing protein [uncultured Flavobacterium sp.]|uniref:nuclease domain-containing protein n=1 Tax=uncultured Flavobacterium sp. TaxID=165435 RepID=UPI0030CA14D0